MLPMDWVDITIFLTTLGAVLAIGMWAGRKEEDTEDFFLAGRSIPWWGIAGSIFGSNVSANHLVGMMGAGFGIGFAQANYEIMSILGIMCLCYLFIPVYRSLRIYTLSEYLEKRFDHRCRLAYSIITTLVLTIIFLFFTIYFGARSLSVLMEGTALGVSYTQAVAIFGLVAGVYTVFGGMKAVIWTDVFQSFLLLAAGILVAWLVYSQPEIGGFGGLLELDKSLPASEQRIHLILPMNHPKLPWTGIFTGLLLLNFNFFATNQSITQRVLAARSDNDARKGAIAASYLKLLLLFITILPGVAAVHLFRERGMSVLPDDVFPTLVKLLVPAGYGLVGIIVAGLVGAILSSVDTLLSSGSTLITFDIYKRYIRKDATEQQLIGFGRYVIFTLIVFSSAIAIFFMDPDGKSEGFLKIASATGHFVPGVIVTFMIAILCRWATGTGALFTLLLSPIFSFSLDYFYNRYLGTNESIAQHFGVELNFLHRTAVTCLFSVVFMAVLSCLTRNTRDEAKERLVFWDIRNRLKSEGKKATFWKSERPWTILLLVLGAGIIIYFA